MCNHALKLAEDVRGDEDELVCFPFYLAFQYVGSNGIEARSRLVKDKDIGIEEESQCGVYLLTGASRQGSRALSRNGGDVVVAIKFLVKLLVAAPDAFSRPENLAHAHVFRESAVLLHPAYLLPAGRIVLYIGAIDKHFARLRGDEPEDTLHQCRLAAAVRTYESYALSGIKLQVYVV